MYVHIYVLRRGNTNVVLKSVIMYIPYSQNDLFDEG